MALDRLKERKIEFIATASCALHDNTGLSRAPEFVSHRTPLALYARFRKGNDLRDRRTPTGHIRSLDGAIRLNELPI